jgi:hypothetical protein
METTMNSKLLILFSAIFLLSGCASTGGGEHSYVTSIPQTVPQDSVFRVNIQRVNGKQPIDAREYHVPAGEATIRVSLILDRKFMPQLISPANQTYTDEITFEAKPGMTYQLAGKIDEDATEAQIKSGDFWTPVVYKEYPN